MVNEMMQSKPCDLTSKWLPVSLNQMKRDASKTDKKMCTVIFSSMFHLEKKKAFLEA